MLETELSSLLPHAPTRSWIVSGRHSFELRQPAVLMGILNVTPDSFSDGGRLASHDAAVDAALKLVADGAAIIDIGGESSRPGAAGISADEERRRVMPVIERLHRERPAATISVDTCKASVARDAIAAGAALVNDISAGSDPEMLPMIADAGASIALMHMQGTPRTMQASPRYENVVDEVIAYLHARLDAATSAGIPESATLIDPGIGFGKTVAHNLELLRALPRFSREFARPLVIGISRKSFLSSLRPDAAPLPAAERDGISHVLHALMAPWCAALRVHDVRGARDAIALAQKLRGDHA